MLKTIKVFDSVNEIGLYKERNIVNPHNSEETPRGYINYEEKEIRLFHNKSFSELQKTLLHEILHILIRELCITEISEHAREEEIIDLLAMGLITVLLDNKLTLKEFKDG